MRLALLFDQHRDDTVGIYVERAARALGLDVTHTWARDAALAPRDCDLYLRVDHGDDYAPLPPWCRPSVFYAMDTHLRHSWKKIRRMASGYDLVCCCHRDAAQSLPNGAWVPVGCDLELHGPRPGALRWDVGFVGTPGGIPRKFLLEAVHEAYPNSFIGQAPHTHISAMYSQSRIGFNYSIRHDINMRMFEVMAAGTLLITNRLPHDDLSRLGLHEGTHYLAYGSPDELFPTIERALREEAMRRRVAEASREHVHQHHTYTHRLRQILDVASQRLRLPALRQTRVPSCASS